MPGDPRSGRKVWEALDREIGKPGENRGQITAQWEFEPAAASTTERIAATLWRKLTRFLEYPELELNYDL